MTNPKREQAPVLSGRYQFVAMEGVISKSLP